MLVRMYRLTDKLGLVVMKSTAGVTDLALESAGIFFNASRQGGGGILGVLLAILLGLANLLLSGAKALLGLLQTLFNGLRLVFGRIFNVGASVAVASSKVTSRAGKVARRSTVSAAENTMARRAAKSELEATLVEDPLRSQNRLLSALFVIVLAGLVGVVIWATNSDSGSNNSDSGVSAVNLLDADDPNATPIATSASGVGVDLPTPVPTAQELPQVLQAGGTVAFVARELGQNDIWVAPVDGGTPLRFTNDPADDRDPSWSPDGTQLAFASRRDGNWDIYIQAVNAVGVNEPRRMTFGLGFEAAPDWSPDGAFMVYESYQGGDLDLYIMPSDGSEAGQRLPSSSEFPEYSPAWSPNEGRQIAYVSLQDGNQEIYLFDLTTQSATNISNTATLQEDFPAWSPDGNYLAYSAIENGLEIVFVKDLRNPNAPVQRFRQGRMPFWSPDGNSIIYTVDTSDGGTQFVVAPFTEGTITTSLTGVALPASNPVWTSAPLSPAFVNSGGLQAGVTEALYDEQVAPADGDPPYTLGSLVSVEAENPVLSDRVNESFNALREHVLQVTGLDFLGELEHAFWGLDYRPQPGEENPNWHMTGRAFSFNRNLILGFPASVEIVREDSDLQTYWRVYVRVAEDAQQGELGEPLRHFPWQFPNPNEGDVQAFDQGGRLQSTVPEGYYIDLTQIVADFDWERVPAGTDWRANVFARNYWMFLRTDGLTIYEALRELYPASQLGGYNPTATPPPIATEASDEDEG